MKRHKPPRHLERSPSGITIGISWFDRTSWARLREAADDVDTLDDTFEDWQKNAENTFEQLERNGLRVERVMVDIEELVVRCRFLGRPVDGPARSEYVSWKLAQKYRKGE